eukprot:CAMPEP_0117692382 /NCGR_PEP_ID=MMETSP0804-20121206/26297_1 /TAXON_ID=1074897 /ORGANISM="Tetraselmis astigmatica, Strain CCMP880" /LENGTH=51 /DNA_ID=CAMNT_0005505825 /DNA_START=99 /DNA_END=252 /DNA_ORIENTATION=-
MKKLAFDASPFFLSQFSLPLGPVPLVAHILNCDALIPQYMGSDSEALLEEC